MAELDTLTADAAGAPEQQTEPDIADLLAESEALDIPEPDDDDEPAADDEAEDEKPAAKSDGQDAEIDVDGRKVSVRELTETFRTFSRKAQEYAETDSRREVEARTAIATAHEQAAHQIAALANGINELVLPGVDMQMIARLRLEDPARAGELLTSLQIVERWKHDMLTKAGQLWEQSQAQRGAAQRKADESHKATLESEASKLTGEKWFTDAWRAQARGFVKAKGIPEAFVAEATKYAGAVRIIRAAMQMEDAQKRLKEGKQPTQATQVPASGKSRAPTGKQKSDALFAQARKNPDDRRASAAAYTSLLGG